jgi:phenylacetate-coenzyme A ligase PaaK-like adenylate-forming protein
MSALDVVEQARTLSARDHAPRADIEAVQQRRLDALVAHARERSPYYRERLRSPDGRVELRTLPTLDKATLMDRWDEIVCDPKLRRDTLLERLAGPPSAEPYLGEYRVMSTSGSSGRAGLFVYDAAGWAAYVAQFLRVSALAGLPMWEHRGLRVGVVSGSDPRHVSAQVAMTCAALGLVELRPLPVTLPLERIVDGLNDYQPDVLHAYASYAALLADEQHAGRLRIAPRLVTSGSELLTANMARRVDAAFGTTAFDFYSATEGLWAAQCPEHAGFHLFEELAIVENVDADNQPVPAGEPGARVLLTNLANRVQPLIRYEIPDVVTIDPEPCPCGRTLKRLGTVHGRSDDVLSLRGVTVHPLQFAELTANPDIREFQVVQHGDRLTLNVVLGDHAAAAQTTRRVHDQVATRLRALGVTEPHIDVETCATIERPASGKLRLVIADPALA